MIVTLRWLRDYVDIGLPVEDLAHGLTMAGLEVEGIHERHAWLRGVVAARVEAVEKHPGADRLSLCRVTDGEKSYRVVCGAPNVREGIVVPLALPGTQLPGGLTLREATVRGQLSQGMLCSQKELELGEDAAGIWVLPPGTPVGAPLSEALGIGDTVIEVSITPNRADCLSVLGIAREAAAICGLPLRYPSVTLEESGPPIASLASVTIDDPSGCPRYAARLVEGVAVGPSPRWLRDRLESVGLRSINNIVDVTNFVLMDMGQPLHAFDFNLLREHRIEVRRAVEGERFTTLDGVERTLFDDTLLICDGLRAVAIAGIMGGLNSEINPKTRRVLIESAYFEPRGIRRTTKKLGLRSEASYRFERGVDPEGVLRALDRAAALMVEVGGGEIASGRIDVYPAPIEAPELTLRVDRTNKFLGTRIEASEMARVLRSIEMKVEEAGGALLRVTPPAFRHDIAREVDLTEEIARLVGYDSIPVTYPGALAVSAPEDPHLRLREAVKDAMRGFGFFEAINYSFTSREAIGKLRLPPEDPRLRPVEIKNPLSDEQAVVRTSLIPGLIETARYNFDHKNEDLQLFELSKAFLPNPDNFPNVNDPSGVLPVERHCLAGVMAGRRRQDLLYGGEEEVGYEDVKGVVEEALALFHLDVVFEAGGDMPPYLDPWRSAILRCGEDTVGAIGLLHSEVLEAFGIKKKVFVFELDFDRLYERRHPRLLFRSMPKFPSVTRDMALVVDDGLPVREPLDLVMNEREPLLETAGIFDLYRGPQFGEGRKSVGYRLVYRAADRNLTDEEVNGVHGRLVEKVIETFKAVLR